MFRKRLAIGIAVGLLASVLAGAAAAEAVKVAVSATPATEGGNSFYTGNRAPLRPAPLIKLPAGRVEPRGWLREQLVLEGRGMIGHLTELSRWCRFEGSAWTDPKGEGDNGWEELPYWLKGYVALGAVLKDERLLAEAKKWLEATLASQREDGYFGPQANRDKHDLWPNMVMLYALRTYHEITGDARILDFMTKYFRWQTTVPFEHFVSTSWQHTRAADNLDSIHWLYNRTGQRWLLELARANHESTARWTAGIASFHGVNFAQCFRGPAQYWQQTHDARYLRAAERNYDQYYAEFGQVPGGMYGADENARKGYISPRNGAETCAVVEMMHSQQMLLSATGDITWADRCEDVAFNTLPAAWTADLKALHYITCPNQVQLDRADKSPMIQNKGDMFTYSPYEQYRCCQHDVAFGWPYLAERLWMATPGNGLSVRRDGGDQGVVGRGGGFSADAADTGLVRGRVGPSERPADRGRVPGRSLGDARARLAAGGYDRAAVTDGDPAADVGGQRRQRLSGPRAADVRVEDRGAVGAVPARRGEGPAAAIAGLAQLGGVPDHPMELRADRGRRRPGPLVRGDRRRSPGRAPAVHAGGGADRPEGQGPAGPGVEAGGERDGGDAAAQSRAGRRAR